VLVQPYIGEQLMAVRRREDLLRAERNRQFVAPRPGRRSAANKPRRSQWGALAGCCLRRRATASTRSNTVTAAGRPLAADSSALNGSGLQTTGFFHLEER